MKITEKTWATGDVYVGLHMDQKTWEKLESSQIWRRFQDFVNNDAPDLKCIDALEPSSHTHDLLIDTSRRLYMLDGKKLKNVLSLDAHIDGENNTVSILYDLI